MGTTQLEPHAEQLPEPKYWQLKTVLSESLDSEFSVGEVLPNERELAARFGVARATLRQALDQLELEGRLQRRRGVGTTVAPPRVGVDVSPAQHAWPGEPGDAWAVTDAAPAVPPPPLLRLLDLRAGQPVEAVHRTRMTHGQSVATEVVYVPPESLPADAAHQRLTGAERGQEVLRALRRTELGGQERAVELGCARTEEARRLDRLPGAPVLLVTTRYFAGGRTAAVGAATYRADTCRLTFGNQGAFTVLTG